ncbi:MAG: ChaN family lipoprotein [Candidatus Aminicenantes bacterium]|nr:ChaN family lipoprotein [Candidatus Aminicenantes bacterium]
MVIKRIFIMLLFMLPSFLIFPIQEIKDHDGVLRLQIGDKELKGKIMPVYPGKISDSRSGKEISFDRMIKGMQTSRFIYIGETHDSMQIHDIQTRIIKALYAEERNLVLGMEMFPVNYQEVLNKWSLGILTEKEFIREAKWYINWNFNFGYYAEIFHFAKAYGLSLYALNAPREIISKIRKEGWEHLSEEEKKLVPQPDLSNQDHQALMKATFENLDMPPQMKGMGLSLMFDGLYRAQVSWDEVMAANSIKAWNQENKRVVVLAGSGHLLYNLGINRIVHEDLGGNFKTVVCVDIPGEKESVQVSRSLADYVWGITEDKRPVFPSWGLSFKKIEGLENPVLERKPINGAAVNADFEKGDVILFVDGEAFKDINELRFYLAKFSWGDKITFRILRDGEEKEVRLDCVYVAE